MKILLINPRSEDDYFRNAIEQVTLISKMMKKGSHAAFSPLALTTIAALTPAEHEVDIHDEFMSGPAEEVATEKDYDIIGITSLVNQVNRTLELARHFSTTSSNCCLVAGGAGTMKMSEDDLGVFNVVFYGEAEDSWPQFLQELATGHAKPVYQQDVRPDMTKSPIPRWEPIAENIPRYGAVTVQTTRGCPFDCDFCDVIHIYGRTQRSKEISQVVEEVRVVQQLGGKLVMLADDNFGSKRAYAKTLLRELIAFNHTLEVPLGYITQSDITISEDEELLELMADCNFIQVLIGIESVDQNSLENINKKQNLRTDMLAAVKKIQSYCVPVLGSIIFGMDSDDQEIFQKTITFVEEASIMDHNCHPLMAPEGTRLWHRMKAEGRLVNLDKKSQDRMDILTNIIPKNLTRSQLMEGLADYSDVVYDPDHFARRVIGFIHNVKRKPNVGKIKVSSFWRFRKMMTRTFFYYTTGVPKGHRKAFFSIMKEAMRHAPFLIPKLMFIYTSFLINEKRAEVASRLAREYIEQSPS
ncbi:MAG: DUF4070 domain-containing protein [Desulfobulbaceae bacterium]|nr:MAG: DUF4070 domain-containing protein [Desulfobulbaceae bacterium]